MVIVGPVIGTKLHVPGGAAAWWRVRGGPSACPERRSRAEEFVAVAFASRGSSGHGQPAVGGGHLLRTDLDAPLVRRMAVLKVWLDTNRITAAPEPTPYSSLGAATAGQATANAAGMTYAEVMRTRLFDPLGMRDITLQTEQALLVDGRSPSRLPWIYDAYAPAGAAISTADDLPSSPRTCWTAPRPAWTP